jgi:hypothetical protein
MPTECHSVVRAPAFRVTRLDGCGNPVESACSSATEECFVQITLTKVYQDRQDAQRISANGILCVDKPKFQQLRWFEVAAELINVNPSLLNIMTSEPLVLSDAADPVAIGWDSEDDTAGTSNFALEFWVGTEDEECEDGEVSYGYGLIPWVYQATTGDETYNNDVVTFTVTGITRKGSPWGVGPYNVRIVEAAGPTLGDPAPLLTPITATQHKRFFWTKLAPPVGQCDCTDVTPELEASPLTGTAPESVTFTIPVDSDGNALVPGVLVPGDAGADVPVTAGPTVIYNYTVVGDYTATYYLADRSGPVWTSQEIVIT